MAEVTVRKTIQAPLEDVFNSWTAEYADIYKFNPNLKYSYVLSESPSENGIGALRQCDMKDGKNWLREKVLDIKQNERIVIDIYDGTMPLKSAVATFNFKGISKRSTELTMTMVFEPKMGLIGKMMVPMMKKQFKPMLMSMLEGNAQYVEHGAQVNVTLDAA